jgi:hypothetical protein
VRIQTFLLIAGLAILPASRSHAQPVADDPEAALLLARARQNHYKGDFTAGVICVRESFLTGRDTLRGVLDVRASRGERRLTLRGARDFFDWWSRLDGREQWRREGLHGRPRRVPPHSLKKPAFAPDVSFEDLARLPFGHLEGFRAVRRAGDTDSTLALQAVPDGALAALYASLEVTLGREPVALRRIAFTGHGSRPSKVMEIVRYTAGPAGLFPAELLFRGGEGLSSVRMILTPLRDDLARDKAFVQEDAPHGFAEPKWLPSDEKER